MAPLAGLGHAAWNAARTPEGAVLYFVEIDLVDTYRDIAVMTAGAVRARDWSGAWLDELEAAAGDFHRYLHLARMLSADALRPELWQLLQVTSASLLPWVEAFRPFIGALAELLEPKPAGAWRTRRKT